MHTKQSPSITHTQKPPYIHHHGSTPPVPQLTKNIFVETVSTIWLLMALSFTRSEKLFSSECRSSVTFRTGCFLSSLINQKTHLIISPTYPVCCPGGNSPATHHQHHQQYPHEKQPHLYTIQPGSNLQIPCTRLKQPKQHMGSYLPICHSSEELADGSVGFRFFQPSLTDLNC